MKATVFPRMKPLRDSSGRFQSKFLLILAIGLTLGLGGCQNNPKLPENDTLKSENSQDKKVILTTFTVLADMVQNVAGEAAIAKSLVKIGSEIHGYEPTPSDLVKAQKADLILDNGFGLERWAQRFYSNLKDVPKVTISEGITPININEDAYKGKPNPHAWMSPKLALIYVDNIRKALIQIDPKNTEIYNNNAKIYSDQIKALDQQLQETIKSIPPEKRFMVTCEGAFSYLARDYGLKEVYIWPVNSEQQATPKQVQKVIDTVKNNQIPVVFCESTVNTDPQKQVAQTTGAKFGGLFYVDSLSQANGPVPTYLDLLQYNVETLVTGLK